MALVFEDLASTLQTILVQQRRILDKYGDEYGMGVALPDRNAFAQWRLNHEGEATLAEVGGLELTEPILSWLKLQGFAQDPNFASLWALEEPELSTDDLAALVRELLTLTEAGKDDIIEIFPEDWEEWQL